MKSRSMTDDDAGGGAGAAWGICDGAAGKTEGTGVLGRVRAAACELSFACEPVVACADNAPVGCVAAALVLRELDVARVLELAGAGRVASFGLELVWAGGVLDEDLGRVLD